MTAAPVLLWFRRDLRIADNPALFAAVATNRPIVAAFVLDDETPGPWSHGGAGRWWLHHSLAGLDRALADRGVPLILRRGRFSAIIPALVSETGAVEVHAGLPVEPWARTALRALAETLPVKLHVHVTTLLARPDAPRTQAGGPYGVFSPYARACLARGELLPPAPAPDIIRPGPAVASATLDDLALLPSTPDWAAGLRATWTPGETGATARLQNFAAHALTGYATNRDLPGIPGTSALSPHLAFGEISARQVWHACAHEKFRGELLWREFAAHLLWHHRDIPTIPLKPAFAAMPWRDDPAGLRAWQRGQTGIPIVDAGMRQLWQTGWMHNRVRMIAASFLVKHLLIPWQAGEAWFWDTLVDADLATNAASWQWVAGSGADAAPYFRIFNPVLQGRKFDANGAYVRRYVPEIARLPDAHLHAPWEAPPAVLTQAGIRLGRTYPRPVIDLAAGRTRALAALAHIAGRSAETELDAAAPPGLNPRATS